MTDSHPLGVEPIGRLLIRYSAPAIVGQTAISLYNIISAAFIGQYEGPLALTGLAISFPIMNLTLAVGLLLGLGGAAISSIRLGEGRQEDASRSMGCVLTLSLICGVTLAVLSVLFLDPLLRLFGASDEALPYARDYMRICLLSLPVTYPTFNLNHVMRATGYPRKAMMSLLLTVLLNVPLAWLFIAHWRWGMTGAALSSTLSQMGGLVWVMSHFAQRKSLVRFQRGIFRPRPEILYAIVAVGMAPFLLNVCACCVVAVINMRLLTYGGDIAVSAYGIINRVLFLMGMVVAGLTQGMQPIVGYNFGARRMDRVSRTLRLSITAGTVVTVVGFLVFEIFPWPISRLFTTDPELLQLTVSGMRLSSLAFVIVGSQIVISSFFQSIGQARMAVFLTTTRQLLFLIPALIVLPLFFGLDGVWLSLPLSDTLSEFVTVAMLVYYMKKTPYTHSSDVV